MELGVVVSAQCLFRVLCVFYFCFVCGAPAVPAELPLNYIAHQARPRSVVKGGAPVTRRAGPEGPVFPKEKSWEDGVSHPGPLTSSRSGRLFLQCYSGDAAGAGVDLALLCVSVLLVPRRALVAREGLCPWGRPLGGGPFLLFLVVLRCVFAAQGVDAIPQEGCHALCLQEPRSHVQDVFHL